MKYERFTEEEMVEVIAKNGKTKGVAVIKPNITVAFLGGGYTEQDLANLGLYYLENKIEDGTLVDLKQPFIYESENTYQVFFKAEPNGQLAYLSYPKTQKKQAIEKLKELRGEQ